MERFRALGTFAAASGPVFSRTCRCSPAALCKCSGFTLFLSRFLTYQTSRGTVIESIPVNREPSMNADHASPPDAEPSPSTAARDPVVDRKFVRITDRRDNGLVAFEFDNLGALCRERGIWLKPTTEKP